MQFGIKALSMSYSWIVKCREWMVSMPPGLSGIHIDRLLSSKTSFREMEVAQNKPRTPIIALTAQMMQGDQEKCMEAGMDDFVSKPIGRKLLNEAINRWLKPK